MRSPVKAGAAAGALWGLAGYAVLWGYVPIEVHPPFVASALGTFLLLPVRLVLWGIHGLETAAGRSFDLSSDSGLIGLAIVLIGAAVAALVAFGVGAVARAVRSSGGESVPQPSERV